MEFPDVLTADSAVLERQLQRLPTPGEAAAERWRREARAELTRRRWTRVESSAASGAANEPR